MATWSSRRKFIYASTIFIVFAAIIAAIFFSIFYKKPTCFDGVKNGNESGIDCGGSCRLLCQSNFLPPKILWGGGKAEKLTSSLYNVASYIVNPNTNGAALNVPYRFSLYDSKGILIAERQGKIDLPAHRNTLAFEPAVNVGTRTPVKVIFEFLESPVWFKSHDTLGDIAIVDKKYSEDNDANSSSLEVTLENRSLVPYRNVTVSAILSDVDGNAIGFSRTMVDVINPKGDSVENRVIAPFTWNVSRHDEVTSIEALPVQVPVQD
jgi:hypothetical protein